MKYLITIGMSLILITGCSIKNLSVKKSATYGAIVGASAVGAFAATSSQSSQYAPLFILGAVFLATIGALVGGTVGYAFSSSDEEEMRENISSQNFGLVPTSHKNID